MALLPMLAALAGGQFLMRRMTTEGWPTLERLLRSGAAQRLELSGDKDARDAAPGARRRVRVAVLRCVADIATTTGASALRGCVLEAGGVGLVLLKEHDVAAEAAEVCCRRSTCIMHTCALQMLRALAHVDPDAVWWLLKTVDDGVASRNQPKTQCLITALLRDVDMMPVPWHKDAVVGW